MTAEWRSRLKPAPKASVELIELGHITGVFGVAGEVRLHLENRESKLLAKGRDVVLVDVQGLRFAAHMKSRPGTNGRVIATIRGVDDREAARGMVGVRILVDRDAFPRLAGDEYYLADLIGLKVRCGEEDLGRVVAVHDQGPVDVIELDGQRYLPSTTEHIESIDFEAGVLFVQEGAVAV